MPTKTFRWVIALNLGAMILNLAFFIFLTHSVISIVGAVVSAMVTAWVWNHQEPWNR